MPISYSCSFYTNPRIMEAESKILEYFQVNRGVRVTMEFLESLTGESKKTIEKAMTQIRRYPGYGIDTSKKGGITTYQVTYDVNKDPWAKLLLVSI